MCLFSNELNLITQICSIIKSYKSNKENFSHLGFLEQGPLRQWCKQYLHWLRCPSRQPEPLQCLCSRRNSLQSGRSIQHWRTVGDCRWYQWPVLSTKKKKGRLDSVLNSIVKTPIWHRKNKMAKLFVHVCFEIIWVIFLKLYLIAKWSDMYKYMMFYANKK